MENGAVLAQMALDDPRTGILSWDCLNALVKAVRKAGALLEEVKAYLKARLKSEYAVVVLNTLTVLHTLVLNSNNIVRSQLAGSKVIKAAERILNKPQAPGLELAVAQLFFDWSYTYGREELGGRCYQLLNTGKNRVLLSVMAPSDVVVMMGEDRKIGMPRLGLTKGLDFAQMYGDPSLAGPARNSVSFIMTALAKRALAPLGGSTGSTQAALQQAEGQDEPKVTADKLLLSIVRMQGDVATLAAVERACREVVKKPGARQQLSRHLDDGYVAACRCATWRGKIQDLVQSGLDGDRMDRLLAAADSLNTALDAWQTFASADLFKLMGVDVAAHIAAAQAAPAQQPQQQVQQQRQQQQRGDAASSSTSAPVAHPNYMDLFTGGSSGLNPFDTLVVDATATSATGAAAVPSSSLDQQQQQQQQQQRRHTGDSVASPRAAPLDLLTGDDPLYVPSSPHSSHGAAYTLSPNAHGSPNPFTNAFASSSSSVVGSGSLNAAGSTSLIAAGSSSQHPFGSSSLSVQQYGSSSSLQHHSSSSNVQPEQLRASMLHAGSSNSTAGPQFPAAAADALLQTASASAQSAALASTPLHRTGSSGSSSSNDTGSGSYINPFVNIDAKVLAAAGIVPGKSQPQPMRAITGTSGPASNSAALPHRSVTGGDSTTSSSTSNPFMGPAVSALVQQQRQQLRQQASATGPSGVAAASRQAAPTVASALPSSPSTIRTTPFDPFAEEGSGTPRTPSRLGPAAAAAAAAASGAASGAGAAPKRQPPPPPAAGGSAYPPVPAPGTAPAVQLQQPGPATPANGYLHSPAASPAGQLQPGSKQPQAAQAAQPSQAQLPSGSLPTSGIAGSAEVTTQRPFLPLLLTAFKQAQEAAGPSSKPGGCCRACVLPPQQALMGALHGVLADMQRQHQQELQELRVAHEQEVASIKATAVARIKELMAATQR